MKYNRIIERYRIRRGEFASSAQDRCNGVFVIPGTKGRAALQVIVSDGTAPVEKDWEHASVSLVSKKEPRRCPTWEEMCFVKDLFWGDDECVVQYHVPAEDHQNLHEYVLHLWKRSDCEFIRPPGYLV